VHCLFFVCDGIFFVKPVEILACQKTLDYLGCKLLGCSQSVLFHDGKFQLKVDVTYSSFKFS